MSIYDDILTPRRPARVPTPEAVHKLDAHLAETRFDLKTLAVHTVGAGVSIAWLMQGFRMGRVAVEKALAIGNCRPISSTRSGGALYDLPQAAACLVVPKTDLRAYLKTLKPGDLPEHMQEGYWNARLKEQKFRELAGDLWPTESVLEVFASTFKAIKEQTQLWPDTLESAVNLTQTQHKALTYAVDQLLDDIRSQLVSISKKKRSPSQLGELDDEI